MRGSTFALMVRLHADILADSKMKMARPEPNSDWSFLKNHRSPLNHPITARFLIWEGRYSY